MKIRFGKRRSTVAIGLTMLFVGLGVGAATALLFAPRTGQQMRRTLKRKLEDAAETVGEFREQAGDAFERGAAFAKEATLTAKEKIAPLARVVSASS